MKLYVLFSWLLLEILIHLLFYFIFGGWGGQERQIEREQCIHANNMTSRILIKRAITSDRVLKSFSCNGNTPIPFSAARILAKIPIFLPQSSPNFLQCPHCEPITNTIEVLTLFLGGPHQKPRIHVIFSWNLNFKALKYLHQLKLPSFWWSFCLGSVAAEPYTPQKIKTKQKMLIFFTFFILLVTIRFAWREVLQLQWVWLQTHLLLMIWKRRRNYWIRSKMGIGSATHYR